MSYIFLIWRMSVRTIGEQGSCRAHSNGRRDRHQRRLKDSLRQSERPRHIVDMMKSCRTETGTLVIPGEDVAVTILRTQRDVMILGCDDPGI